MACNEQREIEVSPIWISGNEESRECVIRAMEKDEWNPEINKNKKDPVLTDEQLWCDRKLFNDIFRVKEVLNNYDQSELNEVRKRSNPHDPLISNKIMNGHYSHLTASIDRVTDFLLTGVNKEDAITIRPLSIQSRGENVNREEEMFYFAESQTLPVPFSSQYIMIRRGFYNSKCFVPRLAPMHPISALSSLSFVDYNERVECSKVKLEFDYGHTPYAPGTREKFIRLVLQGTRGKGVDLYHGFAFNASDHNSAEIQRKLRSSTNCALECNQEVFFRFSYVGQLLFASSIVKEGGKAVLHFLDTNTSLSVSVIYLCYMMFDRVSIYKPNMSRPANAERFLICDGLRVREARAVQRYLKKVLESLEPEDHLIRLIPDRILNNNAEFREHMLDVNNHFLSRQHRFLQSYHRMLEDKIRENTHQEECLKTCLPYYLIPYADFNEMKQFGARMRKRRGGEIVRSWMGKGVDEERMIEALANRAMTIGKKEMREKLDDSMPLLATPVSDKFPTLIVATNHGLEFWSVRKREWITMSRMSTILPADTVFIGDVIEVHSTQTLIVRILDVGVIFGDDVSSLPFKKRMKAAQKLVEATRKDGAKQDVLVRVAKYEEIDTGFNPNSYPERVVEDEIFFIKNKIRITRDSRDVSFYAACSGEFVWEI